MKKLSKIGVFIWILLLLVPINLSAANHRVGFTAPLSMTISAIADNSGDNVAPMAAQSNSTSDSSTKIDAINKDTEPTKQDNTTKVVEPVDGVVKNDLKPVTEAAKSSKEVKENKESPVKKALTQTQSVTPVLNRNNLHLEKILLFISSWWLTNPLDLQIWYLFCLTGFTLYLLKLKQFRQPLLFLSIIILGFYLGSSLDPIAAIFNLVPKTGFTFNVAFFILGIAVFLTLFVGRFYCGWLCPLGAVQELIHPETKIRIPAAPDAVLKYLKYLILLIFLYLTWRTGENLWSNYEPLKVLIHFNGSALALFILIVTLLISVFLERPFCRYICPLGAILALTSRLAIFRMRADAGVCMVCGKCTGGECPMNAIEAFNAITDLPKIDKAECIYCLRCQKFCQRSALRVSLRRIDKM